MEPLLLGGASAIMLGCADFVAYSTSNRLGAITAARAMMLVGAVAMAPIFLLEAHFAGQAPAIAAHATALAAMHGMLGAAGLAAFFRAMMLGGVSLAAMLFASHPILILGFYWLRDGLPAPALIVAMVLILAGVALVLLPGLRYGEANRPPEARSGRMRAIIGWSALSVVTYAAAILVIQDVALQAPATGIMWIARIAGATFLSFVIVVFRIGRPGNIRQTTTPLVLLHGMLDVTGFLFIAIGTAGGGDPALIALLSSLFPAVTVLLSVLILKERLTRTGVLGFILILTGAGLSVTP